MCHVPIATVKCIWACALVQMKNVRLSDCWFLHNTKQRRHPQWLSHAWWVGRSTQLQFSRQFSSPARFQQRYCPQGRYKRTVLPEHLLRRLAEPLLNVNMADFPRKSGDSGWARCCAHCLCGSCRRLLGPTAHDPETWKPPNTRDAHWRPWRGLDRRWTAGTQEVQFRCPDERGLLEGSSLQYKLQ